MNSSSLVLAKYGRRDDVYLALTALLLATFLIRSAVKDESLEDGYFVSLWQMLLRYPEILAWESLWTDSYHEMRSQLYGTAKALAPDKPFGFHIQQNVSLNPFYRAEEDYARLRAYADFIKIALYNNASGPRMAAYLERLHETIFHDAAAEDILPFYYKIMKGNEGPFAALSTHGLSPDSTWRVKLNGRSQMCTAR